MKDNHRISVCIIGYGVHPPWNEGCVVTARFVAASLARYCDTIVLSVIDPFRRTSPSDKSISQLDHDPNFASINLDSSALLKSVRLKGKYHFLNNVLDMPNVYSSLRFLNSVKGVDIIHVFNVSSFLFSILSKIVMCKKVVVHVISASALGDSLSEPFIDAYVGTSKPICAYLENSGVRKDKIHYVPPIIDTDLYRPMSSSRRCHEERPYFNIVYMGNLTQERFPTEIIDLLQTVQSGRLKLSVYCPDTPTNRREALTLTKAISKTKMKYKVWVSNLENEEKVAVYNSADVVIFPFTSKVDLYDVNVNRTKRIFVIDPPLTILESMSCGKIVITTRTLSLPTIIENNINGFLVDVGDFSGFVDSVRSVLQNFQQLDRIGINARRTIQRNFSSKIVAEKLLKVYMSVLTKA